MLPSVPELERPQPARFDKVRFLFICQSRQPPGMLSKWWNRQPEETKRDCCMQARSTTPRLSLELASSICLQVQPHTKLFPHYWDLHPRNSRGGGGIHCGRHWHSVCAGDAHPGPVWELWHPGGHQEVQRHRRCISHCNDTSGDFFKVILSDSSWFHHHITFRPMHQ